MSLNSTTVSRSQTFSSALFGCIAMLVVSNGCGLPHFSDVPAELADFRVVQGDGLLEKTVLADLGEGTERQFGNVMGLSNLIGGDTHSIGVFTQLNQFQTIDAANGAIRSQSVIGGRCFEGMAYDVGDDGTLEFVCESGSPWTEVGIYENNGVVRWSMTGSYAEGNLPNDMAGGDLNDDGSLEFCIGFINGLGCFDEEGEDIWRTGDGERYNTVAVIDEEQGVPGRVIALSDNFEVRDSDGHLLQEWAAPNSTTSEFRIVRWPVESATPSVIARTYSGFELFDLQGQQLMEFSLPGNSAGGYDLNAAVLNAGSGTTYLAVLLMHYRPWDRSTLLLFDETNELVYREILGQGLGLLSTTINREGGEIGVLFVGNGPGVVMRYDFPTNTTRNR